MKPTTCFALWALLAMKAASQDPNKPKIDQAKVDAAIDNGCKFLKTQVDTILRTPISMTWEAGSPGSRRHSMIPIAVLTLRHGGVDPKDDAFQRLFSAMMSMKIETTYTAAVMAMALQKVDPVRYQARIAECAQFLIDNQAKNGQWCYGHPTDTSVPPPKEEVERGSGGGSIATRHRDKGAPMEEPKKITKYYLSRKSQSHCAHGDNSNSQYAALGLRAAVECNVVVPQETLIAAVTYWERAQRPDGGWDYGVPANVNDPFSQRISYGSMTIGGYSSIAIYRYLLGADSITSATLEYRPPLPGLPRIGASMPTLATPSIITTTTCTALSAAATWSATKSSVRTTGTSKAPHGCFRSRTRTEAGKGTFLPRRSRSWQPASRCSSSSGRPSP